MKKAIAKSVVPAAVMLALYILSGVGIFLFASGMLVGAMTMAMLLIIEYNRILNEQRC